MSYPNPSSSIWRRTLAFIMSTLLILPSLSGAAIQMGAYSMARLPAHHLSNPMKVAQGVSSASFCGSVGGVAFGAVAKADDGSVVLGLTYDSFLHDGSRLKARVRKADQTYVITVQAYDWEFMPAAVFAAGDQDAVFTYFGHLSDENKEKELRSQGCKVINYHKDVDNTLMGLRLMQADLLAFLPIASYNPTENDKLIEGPGEILSKANENGKKFKKIFEVYKATGARSYVISDIRDGVSFTTTPKAISFKGIPYWACWTRTEKETNDAFQKYHDELDQETKNQLYFEASLWGNGLLYTQLDNELKEIVQRETVKSKYNELLLEKYRQANFKRLFSESDQLTEIMRQEQGGNPPVYKALIQFMHLSALFRYVKAQDLKAYTEFLDTIKEITPNPTIVTPTVLCPPAQKTES